MAEPFNVEAFRRQMRGKTQNIAQDGSSHMAPLSVPQWDNGQNHTVEYYPVTQAQPAQSWPPQGQAMPTPQMESIPVFAPPPGTAMAMENAPTKFKKPRFSLRREKKEKVPKVKKIKAEASARPQASTTSPAMIFMFGLATGILCFFVGSMIMSHIFADNSAKTFADMQKRNNGIQQPVLPKAAAEKTP